MSIGYKHIADLMMEHDILMGGEESGGIGYSRYLPERDGILNSLLLANVMAKTASPSASWSPTCSANSVHTTTAAATCTFPTRSSQRHPARRRSAD